jgi:hypothetical protein
MLTLLSCWAVTGVSKVHLQLTLMGLLIARKRFACPDHWSGAPRADVSTGQPTEASVHPSLDCTEAPAWSTP